MAAEDADSETAAAFGLRETGTDGVEFDIHTVRHRLKQLRDTGDTALYANRGDVECPGCGAAFSRLLVTRKATTTFPESDGSRFCLVRSEGVAYLFRH